MSIFVQVFDYKADLSVYKLQFVVTHIHNTVVSPLFSIHIPLMISKVEIL